MTLLEIIVFVFCTVIIIGFTIFISIYSKKNECGYHTTENKRNKHRWI